MSQVFEVIEFLEAKHGNIAELCTKFGVKRLLVFGSAVAGTFDSSRSDIDLLVEFDTSREKERFSDYFGLKEALEDLLAYPVDLVTSESLINPYFANSVRDHHREIYAA
jgi:predicted nucleotidyltransferase